MSKGKHYAKKIAFEAVFKDKTGGFAKLQSSFQNIQRTTEKTSQSLEKVQKRFRSLGFSGLRTIRKRSEQVAKKFASMSDSFMLPSLGGTVASIFAMTSPAQFEQEMNKLAELGRTMTATGDKVRITTEDLEALGKEIRRIGGATQFSIPDAAKMVNTFAGAGWNDKETLMNSLAPATYLTGAARLKLPEIALEEVAGVLTGVIGSFKLPKVDVGVVADQLAFAFNNSSQNIQELGSALSKVGGTAQMMNITFEESLGWLKVLADNKVTAELAGTAFSGMLARFAHLPEPTVQMLKANIAPIRLKQIFAKRGEFKPGGLLKLFEDLEVLYAKSKIGVRELQDVLGVEAGRYMSGLLKSGSSIAKAVAMFNRDAQGLAGTAERLNNIGIQGLIGSIELLSSAIDETAVKIGFEGGLLASTTNVTTQIKDAVERLNTALTPEASRSLGALVKGIGALAAVLLGIKLATVTAAFLGLTSITGWLIAAGLALSKFAYDNAKNLKTLFQPVSDFFSSIFELLSGRTTARWLEQFRPNYKPVHGPDEEFGAEGLRYLSKWKESLGGLNWNIPFLSPPLATTGNDSSPLQIDESFLREYKKPNDVSPFLRSMRSGEYIRKEEKKQNIEVKISFEDMPKWAKFRVENPNRLPLETYTGWAMEGIG